MINEYIKLFFKTNQTNKTFSERLKVITEKSRIEKETNTEMSTEECIKLLSYKTQP
jgi:septum formation topological specificity factor MinE